MSTATAATYTAPFCSLPPVPKGSEGCSSSSGVRFTLRKRSVRSGDREPMSLSSYNSDFLSGLFADVAKANVLSEFQLSETTTEATTQSSSSSNIIEECSRPNKKSRLSLNSCLNRASCMNLSTLSSGLQSPKGINDIVSLQKAETDYSCVNASMVAVSPCLKGHRDSSAASATLPPASVEGSLPKQNSLAFQLSLLDGDDEDSHSAIASKDVAMLAFPNLPATVSDSSCYAGLTREILARHVPVSETDASSLDGTSKESSFGWFVDLDDQTRDPVPSPKILPHAVSADDLAFQAPTAPKGSVDDSEVEWAQAADTIDSVLGDLF